MAARAAPEEQILNSLKNPSLRGWLKYLALDLISDDYNAFRLAQLAKQAGQANRLGYLSESAAIAAERMGLPESAKLYGLCEALYDHGIRWRHLDPRLPGFAKRIFRYGPQPDLNKKWRVWGVMTPDELEDWISLHRAGSGHGSGQETRLPRQTLTSNRDGVCLKVMRSRLRGKAADKKLEQTGGGR